MMVMLQTSFAKKLTHVVKIVKQYNREMKFFVFEDIYARLTQSDIATILGLPNMGSTHTGMKGVHHIYEEVLLHSRGLGYKK